MPLVYIYILSSPDWTMSGEFESGSLGSFSRLLNHQSLTESPDLVEADEVSTADVCGRVSDSQINRYYCIRTIQNC